MDRARATPSRQRYVVAHARAVIRTHPAFRAMLFGVLFGLAGCVALPWAYSDRLFFGRGIPGGGEVSEAQWNAFVTEVIEPRFPEGFSIFRGAGHWRGDDGASVAE